MFPLSCPAKASHRALAPGKNEKHNRTAQTRTHGSTAPQDSPTISTSTNRITVLNSTNLTYDSNGNLTQGDLYKYKYDAENRMVELRLPNDTLIASYAFDGNSLRVVKVVGADRGFYIYAGTQLISEFADAASNTYSAGTTPGQAGSDSTATMLYQHNDHLTTRLTTDNFGNLSNDQAHYPYGEQWYAGGTADPSVLRKFTSYQKEDEAASGKLNYAVFREHSARVGRFLMADPKRGNVRNPQRLNRYAYVGGDPANRTDRRGLDWEGDDGFVHGDDPLLIVDGGIMPSQAFGYYGGYNGALDAWRAAQTAEADRMNLIPVGCWDGSGFRNEECVRAQNGGSGDGGIEIVTHAISPFDDDLYMSCFDRCAGVASDDLENCVGANWIYRTFCPETAMDQVKAATNRCARQILIEAVASGGVAVPEAIAKCVAKEIGIATGIGCKLALNACKPRAIIKFNNCMNVCRAMNGNDIP